MKPVINAVTASTPTLYSDVHIRNLFSRKVIGEDFKDIYEEKNVEEYNPFLLDEPALFNEMQKKGDSIGIFRLNK